MQSDKVLAKSGANI